MKPVTRLIDTTKLRIRMTSREIERGFTCAHCGYWIHRDTNVRGVDDGRIHCPNCGEMTTCSDR